jgi:hypothetical protein
MRRFKKIDLGIQFTILIASFTTIILGDFPLFINIFFVGFLIWNLFSILLNFLFLDIRLPKLKNRRTAILIHASVIIIYPCLAYIFQILADYSVFYILYVSIMPFYYLWMSYRELQLLDEIHDQVTLLDIGRH